MNKTDLITAFEQSSFLYGGNAILEGFTKYLKTPPPWTSLAAFLPAWTMIQLRQSAVSGPPGPARMAAGRDGDLISAFAPAIRGKAVGAKTSPVQSQMPTLRLTKSQPHGSVRALMMTAPSASRHGRRLDRGIGLTSCPARTHPSTMLHEAFTVPSPLPGVALSTSIARSRS